MDVRVSALSLLAVLGLSVALNSAQEPEAVPVRGLERALWREDRSELWLLCAQDDGAQVRVFDPWLREREPRPAHEMPERGTIPAVSGASEVPLWSGRVLRADADGQLVILPCWWETAPRVRWGPGWAAVELRNARPLPSLLWRRAGNAELHVASFVADRFDGAQQRAQFQGVAAGERIEIALPDRQPRYPPRTEPHWRAFTAPAVDPEGVRPTSEWPSE